MHIVFETITILSIANHQISSVPLSYRTLKLANFISDTQFNVQFAARHLRHGCDSGQFRLWLYDAGCSRLAVVLLADRFTCCAC